MPLVQRRGTLVHYLTLPGPSPDVDWISACSSTFMCSASIPGVPA
jgi:hypothetical protein